MRRYGSAALIGDTERDRFIRLDRVETGAAEASADEGELVLHLGGSETTLPRTSAGPAGERFVRRSSRQSTACYRAHAGGSVASTLVSLGDDKTIRVSVRRTPCTDLITCERNPSSMRVLRSRTFRM